MVKLVSIDVGIRHLAYCIIQDSQIIKLMLFDAGSKLSGIKAADLILKNLLQEPTGGGEWLDADLVIIEAQYRSNVRAQLVAQTIRTWLTVQKIEWKQVPASEKLKVFLNAKHTSLPYRAYKKALTDMAEPEAKLQWPDTKEYVWQECWEKTTKRDDLADCLLQAIAWLRRSS